MDANGLVQSSLSLASSPATGLPKRKIGVNVFARRFVVCKRIFTIRNVLESSF